jgi:two-component system nitrate/nitrite response regulator NarL
VTADDEPGSPSTGEHPPGSPRSSQPPTPSHPPSDPLRVVIADDHPFYREGLAELLGKSGIDVAAEVPNAEAAIRSVETLAPDVVVMDLNMPGMSGIDATRRLAEIAPATRVLVLTVSAQESDVTDAIVAGASGYVLKEAPIEDVVAGIRAAAIGQSFISPRVATLLLRRVQDVQQAGAAEIDVHLTAREREVLGLLAEGRSNQEIAEELLVSTSTVRHHISNILMKLQVQNRVQAAVRAVRGRIV